MIRGMIGVPAGRWTKWLVLVFWLVIVALAGPLSGKLTGAEKNDAQSWLPPKAESTQVLALRSKVVSPNVYPAVVVYDRPSGVTGADKAKAAADAATRLWIRSRRKSVRNTKSGWRRSTPSSRPRAART